MESIKRIKGVSLRSNEIKHMSGNVDELMSGERYSDAAGTLKRADRLLNGALAGVDGLSHLRVNVAESTQAVNKCAKYDT